METGAVTQRSHQSIRLAWTWSLKYLSVKPRLLMKKGWFLEVESQLGKSFKVSG